MRVAKKNLVLLGVFAGMLSFLSPDIFLFLLVLMVMYAYLCVRYTSGDEKRFILSVATFAIALRVVLIVLYYYFFLLPGNMDILAPDGECYQARGWYISRFLTGQDIYAVPSPEQIFNDYRAMVAYYNAQMPDWRLYQVGVFSYLIALIYSILSYVPLLIKFINALLSVLTGVLLYELGRYLFGKTVGRISMLIFVFLPSVFVFSLTSTRDPLAIFLLTSAVYSLTRYYTAGRQSYLILLALTIIAVYFIRLSAFPSLLFVSLFSLFLSLSPKLRWKLFFIFAASLIAFSPAFKGRMIDYFNLAKITNPHIGYIHTPGNNYKIFADGYYSGEKDISRITPLEFSAALAKGFVHYLFEPFPWSIKSKGESVGISQTIFWMVFFPFVVLGVALNLRYKLKKGHVALMYIFIFSVMLSIGEGNVGTVFRHRDMVMPFFIIFGAAGLSNIFGRAELTA